jgi:transposase
MSPKSDDVASFALSHKERRTLEQMVPRLRHAQQLRRVQALLWLDGGESVPEIATRLRVSRQSIYNWVDRFVARPTRDLAERIADAARTGRPRTASGIIDPLIDQLIDTDPRQFGYAATVWTAPLLRHHLEQSEQVAVSVQSVGLAIDRLSLRWKRPRYQLSRRAKHWRQAKGG